MAPSCPQPVLEDDKTVSYRDGIGLAIRAAAAVFLAAALILRGPDVLMRAFGRTWEPFAVVIVVIAGGWVGVRLGFFDRLGRRVVPSSGRPVFAAMIVLGWVFVLAGLTNLDVAVVAATPLALAVAADRGLDGGLLALGVAQTANAGSILLPTANLTTLLVLGRSAGSATYLRMVWPAWLLVGVVTLAVLVPLVGRVGLRPAPVNNGWSLARIGADLAAMVVLACSLRALIPDGLGVGSGFWSAAWKTSTLAATVNNLPAAAAVHAATSSASWGAVAGLAIGPNLILTGSVASVIVRRMARESGVDLPVLRFTVIGLGVVAVQLTAVFVGLRLTGAF